MGRTGVPSRVRPVESSDPVARGRVHACRAPWVTPSRAQFQPPLPPGEGGVREMPAPGDHRRSRPPTPAPKARNRPGRWSRSRRRRAPHSTPSPSGRGPTKGRDSPRFCIGGGEGEGDAPFGAGNATPVPVPSSFAMPFGSLWLRSQLSIGNWSARGLPHGVQCARRPPGATPPTTDTAQRSGRARLRSVATQFVDAAEVAGSPTD